MKANGINAIGWGQYVGTDTVTIEVADLTPAKEAWLHQRFGGADIFNDQAFLHVGPGGAREQPLLRQPSL